MAFLPEEHFLHHAVFHCHDRPVRRGYEQIVSLGDGPFRTAEKVGEIEHENKRHGRCMKPSEPREKNRHGRRRTDEGIPFMKDERFFCHLVQRSFSFLRGTAFISHAVPFSIS